MFRKSCLVAALAAVALLSAAPSRAADLPVKAPPSVLSGYPYSASGFYAGIGAVAGVLSSNVGDATNGTSLYSAGAALDITAGYQFLAAGTWFAVEGSIQYTNMGGAVACGVATSCSVTSRWGFEQRALVGFPIQTVLNVMPNLGNFFPALPALPGGVNAMSATSHPYIFAGLREDDVSAIIGLAQASVWKIQPVAGIGLRQQWTNGLVVDTSAGCTFANTGLALGGGASATFGRDCRAKISFLY